jgi:hypothetical protein
MVVHVDRSIRSLYRIRKPYEWARGGIVYRIVLMKNLQKRKFFTLWIGTCIAERIKQYTNSIESSSLRNGPIAIPIIVNFGLVSRRP